MKNVYVQKDKYNARITRGGKQAHLGRYDTEQEAAQAYDIAATVLGTSLSGINYPKRDITNAEFSSTIILLHTRGMLGSEDIEIVRERYSELFALALMMGRV